MGVWFCVGVGRSRIFGYAEFRDDVVGWLCIFRDDVFLFGSGECCELGGPGYSATPNSGMTFFLLPKFRDLPTPNSHNSQGKTPIANPAFRALTGRHEKATVCLHHEQPASRCPVRRRHQQHYSSCLAAPDGDDARLYLQVSAEQAGLLRIPGFFFRSDLS